MSKKKDNKKRTSPDRRDVGKVKSNVGGWLPGVVRGTLHTSRQQEERKKKRLKGEQITGEVTSLMGWVIKAGGDWRTAGRCAPKATYSARRRPKHKKPMRGE